jgi:hypothetical protein
MKLTPAYYALHKLGFKEQVEPMVQKLVGTPIRKEKDIIIGKIIKVEIQDKNIIAIVKVEKGCEKYFLSEPGRWQIEVESH